MGLRDVYNKIKQRKELESDYEIDDRARSRVEEKKLSANERELNSILKQKREDAIKKQLEGHHKAQQKEYWHKDVINQRFLFKEKTKVLNQPVATLSGRKMSQGSLFMR